jgi:hypothetical protein
MQDMDEGSWPLADRAEAIRHQLPLLDTADALAAYLADRRTMGLRDRLRHSPAHRELWLEIEGLIAAATAWAAPSRAGQQEGTTP